MRRRIAIIAINAAFCTAAFGLGGESPNAEAAIARARAKGREMLARLPNYTCRETVERFARQEHGPWKKLDALNLEVARVGGQEIFAAPGRGFEETDPARIAGNGTIASGDFTGHLTTLFAGDAAQITFHGRTEIGGQPAFRYDFRTPPEAGWTLRDGTHSAPAGQKGSFWVDASSYELLRVVVRADRIPRALSITDTVQRIEYARARVGDQEEVLPKEAELTVTQRAAGLDEVETRNLIAFSGCRAYQAETAISFGPPEVEIPGGMFVETRLETDIDSNRLAIGEGMVAKVESAISKGGKVIVPAGALLKGRVRTLKPSEDENSVVIGLEFSEVEFGNQRAQFSGQLKTVEPGAAEVVVAPQQDRPGAVTFRMPGAEFR